MTKVFYTAQHRPTADIQPVFELRNQQLFSTAHHPQYSHINQALYRIKDQALYRTQHHPDGASQLADFAIKHQRVYLSNKQTQQVPSTQAMYIIR